MLLGLVNLLVELILASLVESSYISDPAVPTSKLLRSEETETERISSWNGFGTISGSLMATYTLYDPFVSTRLILQSLPPETRLLIYIINNLIQILIYE